MATGRWGWSRRSGPADPGTGGTVRFYSRPGGKGGRTRKERAALNVVRSIRPPPLQIRVQEPISLHHHEYNARPGGGVPSIKKEPGLRRTPYPRVRIAAKSRFFAGVTEIGSSSRIRVACCPSQPGRANPAPPLSRSASVSAAARHTASSARPASSSARYETLSGIFGTRHRS